MTLCYDLVWHLIYCLLIISQNINVPIYVSRFRNDITYIAVSCLLPATLALGKAILGQLFRLDI